MELVPFPLSPQVKFHSPTQKSNCDASGEEQGGSFWLSPSCAIAVKKINKRLIVDMNLITSKSSFDIEVRLVHLPK
jgi:hypothetical protein